MPKVSAYPVAEATRTQMFQDWLTKASSRPTTVWAYAAYFLAVKARVSATIWECFPDYDMEMSEFKLFCTYCNVRYRVTNADKQGTVYLSQDFDCDDKHSLAVMAYECKEWSTKIETIESPRILEKAV